MPPTFKNLAALDPHKVVTRKTYRARSLLMGNLSREHSSGASMTIAGRSALVLSHDGPSRPLIVVPQSGPYAKRQSLREMPQRSAAAVSHYENVQLSCP